MTPASLPDLPEAHDPPEAPAWSIRPEQPLDLDQIHELHRDAFRGPAEAELVDAIRSGTGFIPELSLVAATDDGSVLGHILLSLVGFDPSGPGSVRRDVLALAPLAVLPPHQGRGIGSALMRDALSLADVREEPFTVVLGSAAFYGQFGFVAASAHGIDGPYDAAGEAFQVRPRPGAALTAGTVVYPRVFGSV
jgi:predicted N-acetyltransferase YhbS